MLLGRAHLTQGECLLQKNDERGLRQVAFVGVNASYAPSVTRPKYQVLSFYTALCILIDCECSLKDVCTTHSASLAFHRSEHSTCRESDHVQRRLH